MKDMHARIKKSRLLAGLSQKKLADMMGLSKTAVSQWERELSRPSPEHYAKLCEILNVNEQWLIYGGGESDERLDNSIILVPFFKGVKVSAGYGCAPNCLNSAMFPIPKCALKYQSNLSEICCVVARGTSMEPVLLDGSIIAINKMDSDIRDGKMYVIRQNDLLRAKLLYLFPNELHVASFNPNYETEIYKGEAIDEIDIIGRVFWHSSLY